jgi:hypothetical protein
MADEEAPGFTVVDRRHGASGDAPEAETNAVPTASTRPDDSGTSPAATTENPSENAASPHAETSSPAGPDAAAEGDFMPDPATLLVLAAMQMETRRLAEVLLGVFDSHAWRALGLAANPQTGETQQDLPTAQLAIDCVQFLVSKTESGLPDMEKREAQRRLTDLRMNYLARRRESGS